MKTKVNVFSVYTLDDVNKELDWRGLSADDVINIQFDGAYHNVYYREKVSED